MKTFTQEGYFSVKGGKIWYGIMGMKTAKVPLLILHGGPAYPHNYLRSLDALSKDRQIIYYDQLGCGKSDRITDKKLMTVNHYVSELKELIQKLELKKYNILGQSWGCGLAIAFALTEPKGINSIILASPYLSTSIWVKDVEKLRKNLTKNTQEILRKHEKAGTTDSKEYDTASKEFYQKFVVRIKPYPKLVSESDKAMGNNVYKTMWGPKEFLMTGTLKKFNLTNSLHKIEKPVLLICGKYDEATPSSTKKFADLLPDSRMIILKKSAHLGHLGEKELFNKTVSKFLREVD